MPPPGNMGMSMGMGMGMSMGDASSYVGGQQSSQHPSRPPVGLGIASGERLQQGDDTMWTSRGGNGIKETNPTTTSSSTALATTFPTDGRSEWAGQQRGWRDL